MFDRRAFLATAGAGALATALPAAAQTAGQTAATATKGDPKLAALMDRLVEEQLNRSPRTATNLGLDVGARASLRGRIEDRSLQAKAAATAADTKALADLRAIDRGKLSPADRVGYDTVEFQLTERIRQDRFPYGGDYTTYVVSQRSGAYQQIPDFLDSQHPVKTAVDADAYLARLDGFARAIDQDTERLLSEAQAGAAPPSFLLDTTLTQMGALRSQAPAEATVVRSLGRRAAEAGLAPRYATDAAGLFATKVVPALDRQLTAVDRVRQRATADAGVWRLPDGEAYYASRLKWFTTTDLTAEQVHQIGLEQVADLTSKVDAALRTEGFTQGTVLQRLQALNARPGETFPNTDPGRAELLAALNSQMAELDRRLPTAFARLPKAKVDIRRVPPEIQAGAANGYYQGPSLDGSRPGAFYINLADTTEWPKWSLPTLTYHEANPGHHLEVALSRENPDLHLYRRAFTGFSAYSEGWGLYAEQLADELGAYDRYPIGKVGLYQSYLFRAARLVVDTGLHHKRWTREQANKYMVDATGDPPGSIAREIDRYVGNPGQACSYKIGQTVILRLREDARRRLGRRFDLKRFHEVVLDTGRAPLTVLERAVGEQLV
jgi:uncharacterized protein (DUF885 family)